jgi:hypothetical protein
MDLPNPEQTVYLSHCAPTQSRATRGFVMNDDSIQHAYEAQKVQALRDIAQILQQMLTELRSIRQAQQSRR